MYNSLLLESRELSRGEEEVGGGAGRRGGDTSCRASQAGFVWNGGPIVEHLKTRSFSLSVSYRLELKVPLQTCSKVKISFMTDILFNMLFPH